MLMRHVWPFLCWAFVQRDWLVYKTQRSSLCKPLCSFLFLVQFVCLFFFSLVWNLNNFPWSCREILRTTYSMAGGWVELKATLWRWPTQRLPSHVPAQRENERESRSFCSMSVWLVLHTTATAYDSPLLSAGMLPIRTTHALHQCSLWTSLTPQSSFSIQNPFSPIWILFNCSKNRAVIELIKDSVWLVWKVLYMFYCKEMFRVRLEKITKIYCNGIISHLITFLRLHFILLQDLFYYICWCVKKYLSE